MEGVARRAALSHSKTRSEPHHLNLYALIQMSYGTTQTIQGPYDNCPFVVQQATRLFQSENGHAVIGSWIVGDEPCGIGIREDSSAITMDLSRFVPHVIID
jgi:glutathionylspermidine synthase